MNKAELHKPSSLALKTDRQFFRCLRNQGTLSRAAIASITGISKPTVSESANRLLEKKLIVESGYKDSNSSKRPSVLYEVNRALGCCISIALEENSSQIRVCDFQGNEINEELYDYCKNRNQYQFVKDMLALIEQKIAESQLPLLTIGISIADPIAPDSGAVIALADSPFPVAHGLNFADILQQHFQCPVTIDNDVNWATIAECHEVKLDNFIYVFLGRGIGCGLFFNQQLIRGVHGMAGEIGYVKLDGKESLLSSMYSEAFYEQVESNQLDNYTATLNSVAHVLSATCTIVNPDTVIIGGPLSHVDEIVDILRAQLANNISPPHIQLSQHPKDAPLIGASIGAFELALDHFNLLEPMIDSELRGFSLY